MSDDVADYDYSLPADLIARHPAERREAARLLVVDRATGAVAHRQVADLPELLRAGDRLVLNDTRVIPARLLGKRTSTGGRWEGLYLESDPAGDWRILCQTRGKLQAGETIALEPAHSRDSAARLFLQLIARDEEWIWTARPAEQVEPLRALEQFGSVPLPSYMGRRLAEPADFERYQTRFARRPGSVAAPTAGLHFTPELFERCASRSIARSFVTLHVGIGTFRPMAASRLSQHRMHREWCEVSAETAADVRATKQAGGRIVAVGTTTTRTLESAACAEGSSAWQGATDLFIRPPYRFRTVDALLTNFHLPRSTLLVLVAAFAGRELILRTYQAAIRERYRFYSYGDAMLIM